jgi:hypothetical protein
LVRERIRGDLVRSNRRISHVHENVRLRLAAIHARDWLVKLLLMSVILGVWPKGEPGSKGSG